MVSGPTHPLDPQALAPTLRGVHLGCGETHNSETQAVSIGGWEVLDGVVKGLQGQENGKTQSGLCLTSSHASFRVYSVL